MYTWRTPSTPATTAPNTTRVTIVPRAALTVAAVMAALILTVSSAIGNGSGNGNGDGDGS